MNVTDCLDQVNLGGRKITSISASNLEESEFLDSIAKFLNKSKSVRKAIELLDSFSNLDLKEVKFVEQFPEAHC